MKSLSRLIVGVCGIALLLSCSAKPGAPEGTTAAPTGEVASATVPTPALPPAPEVALVPTPSPTTTPAPTPSPEALYFADIAEHPGWTKDFTGKDYVLFHREREVISPGRVKMWVKMVVKGPPERVRRRVIEDLRAQGQSAEGYDDYTETLEYVFFDCSGKSYRRLSSIDYDESGNRLSESGEEYRSTYVVPDTLGSQLFDVACKPEPTQAAESEASPTYTAPAPATRTRTATQPAPTIAPPSLDITRPSYTPPVAENGSYYGEVSPATGRPKTVHVEGYYRKDGTYVRGHYRSTPRKKN